MLGINARVEDLREQIIKDINKAQMPACLLDYVLTEILNDVRMQRMGEIQKERQRYKEEMTPAPGEALAPKSGREVIRKEKGADDNDNPDS